MEVDYPLDIEPATAEYVLTVLQYFDQCSVTFGEPLTFETTVEEWDFSWELRPPVEQGRAINKYWNIQVPDEEWAKLLDTRQPYTLRDVCNKIAESAQRPVIRPCHIAGVSCRPAGAFLTIRSLLASAGADVSQVTPSSSLKEMTGLVYPKLDDIIKLSPTKIPRIKFSRPLFDMVTIIAVISWIAIVPLYFWGPTFLFVSNLLTTAVLYGVNQWIAKLPPRRIDLGDLKTFRDLSVLIAK
ncbi:hypothetical protein [Lacunimicrobium album]